MKRYKLSEITKDLVPVASGKAKADLGIKDGTLINVHTHELLPHTDVAVTHGRIALVGDASHTIGEKTTVINAAGKYIAPGFIDGHLHVESSMLTVTEYARAVMPHGTTAIMMDPHEIANVLGTSGIRLMVDEGRSLPLHVFSTMPSCVPATKDFETNGAALGLKEISMGLDDPAMIGLGEMMNYPAVLNADPAVHDLLKTTLEHHKVITGHYPCHDDGGIGLNSYIASGICCCHESTTAEDALAKMRLGMYVQVREGSAWCDLHALARLFTDQHISTRFACLVSDDVHPDTLLEKGHMDHIIRRAVEEGIDPVSAIEMATINAAQCFMLDRDMGSVTPGKWADIVLLSDLKTVKVSTVLINGELICQDGRLLKSFTPPVYPEAARMTMHLPKPVTAADLKISVPSDIHDSHCRVHVIGITEKQAPTSHLTAELDCSDGEVHADLSQDVLKLVVIDRHSGQETMGRGFVKGFGLKKGAVAATIAHDAHNLSLLGTNDEDMALAARVLTDCGGGQVVVCDGQILALNPLPIAGLMSDQPIEKTAQAVHEIALAWKTLGCPIASPFMTMALLSLAVIPSLRLTNKGLIDTDHFKPVSLFIS